MNRKNQRGGGGLGPSVKEPASRKASGLAHLVTALHQNAAAVVNSKTQLNGPDQILPAEGFITNRRNGCVKLRREEAGLGSEEPISIPTMLKDISEAYPETAALRVKRDGEWKQWTYEQYLAHVQIVARAFIHLGLHRHHSVAILGGNAPEWVISDLGAVFAGGIAVGIYAEQGPDDIARICIDSKADIIVVESESHLKKALLVQHKLPELKAIVQWKGEPSVADKRRLHRSHKKHILSWSQLLDIGEDLPESRLDDRLKRLAINHCCTLVYDTPEKETSAAGPRGVMLSHDNLTWCSKMLLGFIRAPGFNRLPSPGEEVLLSFLPHASVASQTIDIFYTMSIAGTLCFVDSSDLMHHVDAFYDAIVEVQPTVFFGTPAVYESLYYRLKELRRTMSGFQRMFLNWSNSTVRSKYFGVKSSSAPAKRVAQMQTSVAKNTVCKKYKESMGFTSRTVFLSRGDPMSEEILRFLAGYDMLVHESFGQSENSGLLFANIPKRYSKMGTAGKTVPGVKSKVTATENMPKGYFTEGTEFDIGEVRCFGRNVFMGYLNRESETKEVMAADEGWLNLGHLGYLDPDDYLVVHGRRENYVTLRSGEIVVPQKLEQQIRLELPCVRHAVIVGDGEDYVSALLTVQTMVEDDAASAVQSPRLTEEAARWFKSARFGELHTVADVLDHLNHGGLRHLIQAGIDRANQTFSKTSHMVGDWRILPNQFTYQGGEVGLSRRIRRHVVLHNHAKCIQSIYTEEIGAAAICETNGSGQVGGVRQPGGVAVIEVVQRPSSSHLMAQLAQINEEDESKASSRNSIHRQHGPREEDEDRSQEETKQSGTTVVQVEATVPAVVREDSGTIEEDDGDVEDAAESSATFETTSDDASSKASSRKISESMNNNAEDINVVKERITRR